MRSKSKEELSNQGKKEIKKKTKNSPKLLKYEKELYKQGVKFICGVDEVGRGPLVGPVVAAAVILPINYHLEGLNDSKKLSEKKREELFEVIKKDALEFHIEIVSEKVIDQKNIYQATKDAMTLIANKLNAEVVLTDAMPLERCDKEVIDIIKGDQKSVSIAAASILAKVTRDRIMYELDKKYPEYDFKHNKGYPTKKHLEALEQYGALDIHRRSYGPVYKLDQMKFDI